MALNADHLDAHTASCLDWALVLDALAECAFTPMGAEHLLTMPPLDSAAAVREMLELVSELRELRESGTHLSLGAVTDIREDAARAGRGEVLEPDELSRSSQALTTLVAIERTLDAHGEDAPGLDGIARSIDLDPEVVELLDRAFEPNGQLSRTTYPELAELQRRIDGLHAEIRETLDRLSKGDELADVLQDKFWTQRNDRYVLPIKPKAKRWDVGVVQGTSGTGKTVFIEPHAIIERNNRLKLAEGALRAELHRILGELSRALGTIATPVRSAVEAVIALDGVAARLGLSRRLDAKAPIVGEEGVATLTGARHPVLVLREIGVVPNDLRLSHEVPGLVLTGPNTGGKTVALKTVGLLALMVRMGLEIPAAEGSRLDFFSDISAAVGDAQTVEDDLSSFSAQLTLVRHMLDRAGAGSLVLLDELGAGTDPAQGGALARATLQTLVDRGARVVTTTHYRALKGLHVVDPRFAVGAMQITGGRPTYRVLAGATGESHALDTARRLGLDASVVDRAEALLGDAERDLSRTLEALDRERSELVARREAAETEERLLAERRARLEEREERIQARSKQLEQAGAADYLARLGSAEKAIAKVVAQLQDSPSHKRAAAARATVKALSDLVVPEPEPVPEPLARPLVVGDRVRHTKLGQVGEVKAIGDRGMLVQLGALQVTASASVLELVSSPAPPKKKAPRAQAPPKPKPTDLGQAMRLPHNTLDMRGMRVEEGLEAVEKYLSDALMADADVVFLLHGHGTGALKVGVRQWLRRADGVRRYAPANADQGGDAFTVVALG